MMRRMMRRMEMRNNLRTTSILNTLMVEPNSLNAFTVREFILKAFTTVNGYTLDNQEAQNELAETLLANNIVNGVDAAHELIIELVEDFFNPKN
jgi:hypothetical protein